MIIFENINQQPKEQTIYRQKGDASKALGTQIILKTVIPCNLV
jgi:hypothetical protein